MTRMIFRRGESPSLASLYTSRLYRPVEVTHALEGRPSSSLSRLATITRHGTLELSA